MQVDCDTLLSPKESNQTWLLTRLVEYLLYHCIHNLNWWPLQPGMKFSSPSITNLNTVCLTASKLSPPFKSWFPHSPSRVLHWALDKHDHDKVSERLADPSSESVKLPLKENGGLEKIQLTWPKWEGRICKHLSWITPNNRVEGKEICHQGS